MSFDTNTPDCKCTAVAHVSTTCPTNSASREDDVFVTPVKSAPVDAPGKEILPSPVSRKRTLDVSLAMHFALKRLKNERQLSLAEQDDEVDLNADSSGEDYDSDELVFEDTDTDTEQGDDADADAELSNSRGADDYDRQDKFFDWE
jgi:hypothetical protein